MIAKSVKGAGFRGAAEYDLNKEKGYIIGSNMVGTTPKALASEFGAVRKLRPNVSKAVLHVSLSAAPGEKLSDEQWRNIGETYLQGMGFTDNQYIITRHTDTDHEHIHILANRITHGGEVVSDSHDYKRAQALMRVIEKQYNLQEVPTQAAERKPPTKGEVEKAVRTGEPSTRLQLQQLADAAAKDCPDFKTYVERLEAVGVDVIPVVQKGGAKLSGLSYRLDGVMMKGSDLGKRYTASGIQKQGVSYEQNRDAEAVSRSLEREASRAASSADRERTDSQANERGGASSDVRTISQSHGNANGRHTRSAKEHQGGSREAGSRDGGIDEQASGVLERGGERGSSSSQQHERSRQQAGKDTLRYSGVSRATYSSPSERIVALSTATPTPSGSLGRASAGAENHRPDATTEAVKKHAQALNVPLYEIGIRDAASGQMMNRKFNREQLDEAIPWLKRMNARGNDIYIRPSGDHGLVLVDDVTKPTLERMKADGLEPAAIVQTSPNNYQAWVKLSISSVPAEERKIAAAMIATKYDADKNSVGSDHYGRLAGFTNQKPHHRQQNGFQPYVLIQEYAGKVAKRAVELLEKVSKVVDRVASQKERDSRLIALQKHQHMSGDWFSLEKHEREYKRQAAALLKQYGESADFSKLDWMIAKDMAKKATYSAEGIAKAIAKHSPNVETRKAGHVGDYAARTVTKAFSEPDVQAQREQSQQKQQKSRDRGHDHGYSR